MERLSGLDAGFLYMETPTLLMHTLKLAVLSDWRAALAEVVATPAPAESPPGSPPAARAEVPPDVAVLDVVRRHVADRLHLLPPLRRRVVEVPFGLHHPVWIEDPGFDLDAHLHLTAVPAPGVREQVDEVVARIASTPLDRDRPLWDLHVLTGLEDDRLGVLVKVHHAVADGTAAAMLLANVTATAPEPVGHPAEPWVPEPVPSPLALATEALRDQVRQWRRLPRLLSLTVGRLVAVVRRRRHAEVRTPVPMASSPRTRFGGALSAQRSFATTTVPLAQLQQVRHAVGVSVNDVFLAMVSGALRAWLSRRGELPRRSLTAGVPVSADAPDAPARLGGNRVSNLFTTLATDEADPLERLARISRVTAEAKAVQQLLGRDLMGHWVQYTPGRPYAWAVRSWSRHRVADELPAPINVVVSNVLGPREALFAGPASLEALYSVGPILEGVGLNITGWSYAGRFDVAILACRDHIRRPAELARHLEEALAELLAAVDGRPTPVT